MPTLRVRVLAVVGVVVAGAALVAWLDSAPGRAAVVLAVGAAVALGGFGGPRRERRPSADDDREEAADARDQAADRRDRSADQRDQVAGRRDEVAGHRDQAAAAQDQAAGRRDRAAEQRDQAAGQRDEAGEQSEGSGPDDSGRRSSEVARRAAASDRMQALQDRGVGASGRVDAGTDREAALADREAGAGERAHAGLDREQALADRAAPGAVGGAWRAGLDDAARGELVREIDRAQGTREPLVLAFVAVQAGDDARGDGERLLAEVARGLHTALRSYDLVLRFGSGALVCVLPGLGRADATARFALLDDALARQSGSVTVGLAELRVGESADALIARADAARQPGEIV